MFDGNLDGLGSLPATYAALLEDYTFAVQGWTQWTTLGNEQTEAQRPADGWQQLSAGARCVGLPPSASVQPRTTRQIS